MRPSFLVATAALALLGSGSPAFAQADPPPMNLQWWPPVAAGAGVAGLFLVDEPIRDALQNNRSDGLDDIADVTRRFKDAEIYWISSGAAVAVGLLTSQPKVTATGVHIITAYGLAGALNIGLKWAFGRTRPSQTPDDPTQFDWFGGDDNNALPSGSAAVVFSLATTVADAIDRTPASIAIYTAATLNAWARLNSDRHWLSDVALGALVGVTSARLVNGRWTVFGLRPPTIWTDGRSSSLGYTVTF